MDWIPCETSEPQQETARGKFSGASGVRIVQRKRTEPKPPHAPRGNVARLEKIRHRKRIRSLRIAALCAVLLAAVLAGFTGVYGTSLALLGDLVDTVRIALTPGPGYPTAFTLPAFRSAVPLAGGFAAVGGQDLVLYSASGKELRRLQHGYGRADIAVGRTRVCIYNRGGKELRIESRSRTLLERKFDDTVQLCAMSPNGTLAVYTKSKITVLDASFEEIYAFRTQDLPTAMAFCSDNRQLAAGCVYASGGALGGTVYLLHTGRDDYLTIHSTEGMPLKIHFFSAAEVLVVYDTYAAVYKTSDGSELYRYGFGGRALQSVAVGEDKTTALLFGDGVHSASTQLTVLSAKLTELGGTSVRARCLSVSVSRSGAYVLTHEGVMCYGKDGTFQGMVRTENKPLAVLCQGAKPLLLTQGQAEWLELPDTHSTSSKPQSSSPEPPDSQSAEPALPDEQSSASSEAPVSGE